MTLQDISVRKLVHARDPVKYARRRFRGTLRRVQTTNVRTGHINSLLPPAQNYKNEHHNNCHEQGRNKSRHQTRNRCGCIIAPNELMKIIRARITSYRHLRVPTNRIKARVRRTTKGRRPVYKFIYLLGSLGVRIFRTVLLDLY